MTVNSYLQGEVVARLVFHAATTGPKTQAISSLLPPVTREDTIRAIERLMVVQS